MFAANTVGEIGMSIYIYRSRVEGKSERKWHHYECHLKWLG